MTDYQMYADKAKELGAENAVLIDAGDIVVDPRSLLKCMYGCTGWSKGWTCPSRPGSLTPWQFEDILARYKAGLIIHSKDKKTAQSISYEIERLAFLDGHYFSFSMSDCALCPEGCSPPEPCRFPKKARPAMQALGIDVYATVRKKGLPIATLKDESEEPNWYSLVLIE